MQDYVFELDGVEFGIGADIEVASFDPGDATWSTQDQDNPVHDGVVFGRDALRGMTWNFSMFTNKDDDIEALAALSPLATAWRAQGARSTPGAVLPLRYQHGGRVRRVYGRPRRWAVLPGNKIITGNIGIQADFVTADALHYSDAEETVTLALTADPEGGLIVPALVPFLLSGTEQARPGLIVGGGDAPTSVVARFDGPVVGPRLEFPGWVIDLPGYNLPEGQWIDIDTNPWAMTVLRNGVSSVAGSLSRFSRLGAAKIPPEGGEIVFSGTSATGTAQCAVSWRPAWNSL